ncbi:xanthine dehydrogenase small subunit [Myxococcota bacterium]|nr:xanthine dehydrogenase small subunit [Myxococcota bacterium]
MEVLRFRLNDAWIEEDSVPPTTTLLQYVRSRGLTGTKEGCAEGDCGACTVAILDPHAPGGPALRAVNSCLVLLPMVQGRSVWTVEALREEGRPLHPVQEALVADLGSQCGFCTPGVAMSMLEACHREDVSEPWQLDDQMCGNLCRCTGYRPIRDAARRVAGLRPGDRFAAALREPAPESMALAYAHGGQRAFVPTSLPELWDVLDRHADARLVCGGTDLSLEVTRRFREPPCLVSLEGIPALRGVERDATGFRIGAATPLSDLHDAVRGHLPALDKTLRFFASRQIRNRATVGGNLCNASPIGDLPPVLIALGSHVTLASRHGRRRLPLQDFFLGYRRTALAPGEVMEAVDWLHPGPGWRVSAFKVSKRRELDISAVCAGCAVRLDGEGRIAEARLAFGGMAAIPRRASRTEAALLGRPFGEEAIEAAIPFLDEDFQPISDHRGSAWYRRTVAGNLLRGFWAEVSSPEGGLHPRPTSTVHAGDPR